jgi:GT2 family glycosyltransferase
LINAYQLIPKISHQKNQPVSEAKLQAIFQFRPAVSLVITTFNWPIALNLVLQSVSKQNLMPSQVIVVDDGSSANNRSVIASFDKNLPIEIVWQDNRDFRAARARNLGLSRVKHEYVIFVDGDCLMPSNFIQQHLKLAQRRKIIAGSRFLINEKETQRLLQKADVKGSLHKFTNYKFKLLALGSLRDLNQKSWETVRSCNFSMYKDDILEIGGFDESYIGWGREDSDLVVRMLKNGATIRSGRFAACVAHLYHQELSRDQLSVNDVKFKQRLQSVKTPYATNSILSEI